MTDIDFDELDKAVNSLMGQQQAKNEQSVDTSSANEAPLAPATEVQADLPNDNETNQSIVKRPSGRFMDVVHPSSDMRGARNAASGLSPKGGVSIDPLPSATLTAENSAMIESAPPIEAADAVSSAETAPESDNKAMSMADRIARSLAEPAESTEPTESKTDDHQADLSPTTPFIANAAVEKRPLGTPETIPEPTVEIKEEILADFRRLEEIENRDEVAADIDAAIDGDDFDSAPADTTENKPSQPLDEAMRSETTSSFVSAGDIPQQYSTDTAVADPEPEPMFDAALAVPAQLQHKEKKKSGWLTVLLIVIFLLVGVASGAAAYFLLVQ